MPPDSPDTKSRLNARKADADKSPIRVVVPKKRKLLEYSKPSDADVDGNADVQTTGAALKPRHFREVNLERMLFRWYERTLPARGDGSTISSDPQDVLKKATLLARRQGASEEFVKGLDEGWVRAWSEKYGVAEEVVAYNVDEPFPHQDDVKQEVSAEDPLAEVNSGEYTDDQIYTAFAFQLDWTSLPDRTLEASSADDRVWLLMAGNRSGRHRTRMLITGREWRPNCLTTVNMLSQPVVYAGGGIGVLTPDLFTWWFHREFSPAALSLNDRGAVLVIEHADYLPPASDCVACEGKVKLIVYQRGESPYSVYPDLSLVAAELRTRYTMLLLHDISLDQQRWMTVSQFLLSFTLKDAFPMLHRAWLNIRPETFSRCWAISDPLSANISLSFGKAASTPLQVEEDRMLLLELQWLAHDLGLEVTDEDLAQWVAASPSPSANTTVIKQELEDIEGEGGSVPTSTEVVTHLQKVLAWMESEPIEPNLLMVVRDVLAMAKQVGYASKQVSTFI